MAPTLPRIRPARAVTVLLGTVLAMLGLGLPLPTASAAPPAGPRPVAAGAPARPHDGSPRLLARATLPADYLAPGPASGAEATPANGRTGPFSGQVVPGFSAALANPDGTFWAMPDNGFGTKANSEDFLLRIYLVKPSWKRAGGGRGVVKVLRSLTLADPDHKLDFPIVRERTSRRLLTGGDFDIESLQRGADGSFWIGEEFGPFLLHVAADGRLLSAPVPFPLGMSPQNPYLGSERPNTRQSGGFEAMARSRDGRFLYPIVEKALVDDKDPRRRVIAEFDTVTERYTKRRWAYRVDTDANLVADAQVVGDRLLVLERDDFDGDTAVTKRVYAVRLGRVDGTRQLAKSLVADLLKIADPAGISAGGGWGTGRTYSFGLQSVETLVPLSGGRLLIANDTNYPGNAARRPGTPDDTELIVIDPRTRAEQHHAAVVIAHRGASGYRPEHTLASYELAIRMCADMIEPDVVSTKDHVLVARHENEIGGTTDVAAHSEFADRETTKTVDGRAVTGWFVEDFTLAELRTLRAMERLPQVRPRNTAFDGKYPVPTLAEVLDLARHSRSCDGKPVGVAPETKHPSYFASLGLPLEAGLVRELRIAGLNGKRAPVLIQSFEVGNLKRLNRLTPVRLLQLVDCSGAPYDLAASGDPRSYADLVTRSGLREISRYADAIGACKDLLIPRRADGRLGKPTRVTARAHAAGLEVVAWTFRRENRFLPRDFRVGNDPNGVGHLAGEVRTFVAAGLDRVFSDNPDVAVRAVSGRSGRGVGACGRPIGRDQGSRQVAAWLCRALLMSIYGAFAP